MQNVAQVSLPMRIALGVTLAFFALWFVMLRPKPAPEPPVQTPAPAAEAPASSAGKAEATAENAVGNANAASGKREAAAKDASEGTAPSAPQANAAKPKPAGTESAAKPAVKPSAGQPVETPGKPTARGRAVQRVLGDIENKKVVVLLFSNSRLSDDREVGRAVSRIDRHGGKVKVHRAPIGNLADFEPITRGVPIVTSPSVLVIDRARQARVVSGLTVKSELDETVDAALRVRR